MDPPIERTTLKQLQANCQVHPAEYNSNKLLGELIDECALDPTISPETRSKIKRIGFVAKSASYLPLEDGPENPNRCTLLGLSNLQHVELNYDERKQLENLVERKIQNLYEECLQKESKSEHTISLFSIHSQLLEQLELYKNNLLAHHDQLKTLIDAQVNVLPDISRRKIDEYILQAKILEQKMKMLDEKLRVDIFMEIPPNDSLKAYTILIEDIIKQQTQCKTDIEHLSELLEKYKLASCKEYDSILTAYIKCKSSLNKLKLVLTNKPGLII